MSEERTNDDRTAASSLERLVERALEAEPKEDGSEKSDIVKVLLSESYRGAFPHPEVLSRLNQVVDNGAERAFSLTEREQRHRHECDKMLLKSEIQERERESNDRRLVIILAFAFFFSSLGCAFYAVMTGHKTGASLAGGTALATLIGGFFVLRARRSEAKHKEGD